MEFRQLEYFLATARLNNMTEAARQMHVSQPSLSNAVKSLETELGVPLFNRHGKRIELNEAGRYSLPAYLQLWTWSQKQRMSFLRRTANASIP